MAKRRSKSKPYFESPYLNKIDCPVADPELGVISETDHQVGLCLCRFCNCGIHSCPSTKLPSQYLSSTYKSKYSHDFKQKAFDTPLKTEPKKYIQSSEKMNEKTINQETYKAFSVKPQPKKTLFQTQPSFQLLAQSSYTQDFLNWGGNLVEHEKAFHPPLRSTEIPFNASSTYNRNFNRGKGVRASYEGISAIKNNINFGPNDLEPKKSTYSETMRDFNNNELNNRIKQKPIIHRGVSASPKHFSTTTGSFYEEKSQNSKDPRSMRLSLMTRN